MHTCWYRANALFTFASTVLAVLCILCTLSDQVHRSNPGVQVDLAGFDGLHKEFGTDKAFVVLNFTADLRDTFTWNTKQVFLYVMVEYSTSRHHFNQMMLWSQIIERKEDALIRRPLLRAEYPHVITDKGTNLRDMPFNVTVAWNNMPIVGLLTTERKTFTGFKFPPEYQRPNPQLQQQYRL
ncbi:hypothetical protein WJX72_004371 [[Myrmecia] bisecta]|uniref:Signal peptidase complex subunit 3 n=1 Tax=[Myrmecia] bisecta TaxID=41462 RepID=A0AAW1PX31_9CHLO